MNSQSLPLRSLGHRTVGAIALGGARWSLADQPDETLAEATIRAARARLPHGGKVGLARTGQGRSRKRRQQCQPQKALFHFKFPLLIERFAGRRPRLGSPPR